MKPPEETTAKTVIHVRFGSKADVCAAKGHVRFTPESGHVRRNYRCPLWAKSGHLTPFDHLVRAGDARQPLVERTER